MLVRNLDLLQSLIERKVSQGALLIGERFLKTKEPHLLSSHVLVSQGAELHSCAVEWLGTIAVNLHFTFDLFGRKDLLKLLVRDFKIFGNVIDIAIELIGTLIEYITVTHD